MIVLLVDLQAGFGLADLLAALEVAWELAGTGG
jgi:hypothetical protein